MNDLISRQAAIETSKKLLYETALVNSHDATISDVYAEMAENRIETWVNLIPPAQQWIPFKSRPLTAEEKEEHPEWDFIWDCHLPDDGDSILVSTKKYVAEDAFFNDEDGAYLESGLEIGEDVIAWQPLPEPFKELE